MRLVLYEELNAIEQTREAALSELARLAQETANLDPAFVEQVSSREHTFKHIICFGTASSG